MIKYIFSFLIIFSAATATAQDAAKLHETGRAFMHQGDYANAILVLNRAAKLDEKNIEIAKDLGLNYFFAKDYKQALEIIKPLLDRDDADDQCFQIAGDIYQALSNTKECEKVYKKGIKKFPNAGALYNEYGVLLWEEKDVNAIVQWEKGIETDPGFSKNYYNACKYYYFTTDKTWGVVYGEIFLNIEPATTATAEIKNILFHSYKKLFADANIESEKNNPAKNSFVQAFLHTMNKQNAIAASGITPETLAMIRTRFVLDWFTEYGKKFPFKLFEQQQQYLQNGLFDAYNQWLFNAAQNLPAYQNWIALNTDQYNELNRFQKGRIFKIPSGQYYQTLKQL